MEIHCVSAHGRCTLNLSTDRSLQLTKIKDAGGTKNCIEIRGHEIKNERMWYRICEFDGPFVRHGSS